MSDQPEAAVLDYLREQFARLHRRLDHSDEKFDEIVTRLGSVEREGAALRTDFAAMQVRLDGITRRLDRIERRLELADGPTARSS